VTGAFDQKARSFHCCFLEFNFHQNNLCYKFFYPSRKKNNFRKFSAIILLEFNFIFGLKNTSITTPCFLPPRWGKKIYFIIYFPLHLFLSCISFHNLLNNLLCTSLKVCICFSLHYCTQYSPHIMLNNFLYQRYSYSYSSFPPSCFLIL